MGASTGSGNQPSPVVVPTGTSPLTPLKDIVHRREEEKSKWFSNRSILLYIVLQKARIEEQKVCIEDLERKLKERSEMKI